MKKFIFLLTIALVFVMVAFGQDSTAVGGAGGFDVTQFLSNNVVLVLALISALYEVVVRYFPTVKNYSIISYIIAFINFIIPNKKATGGTH